MCVRACACVRDRVWSCTCPRPGPSCFSPHSAQPLSAPLYIFWQRQPRSSQALAWARFLVCRCTLFVTAVGHSGVAVVSSQCAMSGSERIWPAECGCCRTVRVDGWVCLLKGCSVLLLLLLLQLLLLLLLSLLC